VHIDKQYGDVTLHDQNALVFFIISLCMDQQRGFCSIRFPIVWNK